MSAALAAKLMQRDGRVTGILGASTVFLCALGVSYDSKASFFFNLSELCAVCTSVTWSQELNMPWVSQVGRTQKRT